MLEPCDQKNIFDAGYSFPSIAYGSTIVLGYKRDHLTIGHDLNTRDSSLSVSGSYPSLASCLSQPSFFSCKNTIDIKKYLLFSYAGSSTSMLVYLYRSGQHGQLLPKENWTTHGLWPDNWM